MSRHKQADALSAHLAGMAEDGEPLPEPSSLEAAMADRENRDAVAILVDAPAASAKAVRVNMTLPEEELARVDKFAAEHGPIRISSPCGEEGAASRGTGRGEGFAVAETPANSEKSDAREAALLILKNRR